MAQQQAMQPIEMELKRNQGEYFKAHAEQARGLAAKEAALQKIAASLGPNPDPELLRGLAVATGHTPFAAMADHIENRRAQAGGLQALQSQVQPVTGTPTLGIGQSGAPAMRSIIPQDAPQGQIPPEVQAAIQRGGPFAIGVGDAGEQQRVGGALAPQLQSANPGIAQQALQVQNRVDALQPNAMPLPSVENMVGGVQAADRQASLMQAAREAGQQNRIEIKNMPAPESDKPLTDMGKLNSDLKAGRITQQQFDAASNQKAPTGLTPEGIDIAAEKYRMFGEMPAMGMGDKTTRPKIINRAAELAAQAGDDAQATVLRQAANKSAQSAMGPLIRQQQVVMAFEKTAMKNADLVLEQSEKVDRMGVPAIDRWIQAGKESLAGDPEVAKLNLTVRTLVNEYARVTTTVTGGGITSDTARKEIDTLLRSAQTKDQVKGVIDMMRREMANRADSYTAQINELKGSIGPVPKGTTAPEQTMAPAAQSDWLQRAMKKNPGMTAAQVAAEGRRLGKIQ